MDGDILFPSGLLFSGSLALVEVTGSRSEITDDFFKVTTGFAVFAAGFTEYASVLMDGVVGFREVVAADSFDPRSAEDGEQFCQIS